MIGEIVSSEYVRFAQPFFMHRGGVLADVSLAYETFGELNDARDNIVLVLPGLSADSHICSSPKNPSIGWWEDFVGSGKPVNTDIWFVICFNYLGGCKGSTGPLSIDPGEGSPYMSRFPELTIEDIVDTIVVGLRLLGIDEVNCLIGASMGGMCAVALLTRHPGFVRYHINLCGAASSLPSSTAMRCIQREAIRQDPHWKNGEYTPNAIPIQGMTLARKIGLLSYRSGGDLNRRFSDCGRAESKTVGAVHDFEIEDYLQANACRFAKGFDPNSYLQLSRAIDLYTCSENDRGGYESFGLKGALIVGVESDTLFPISQQERIATALRSDGVSVTFVQVDSCDGHDAFLTDFVSFGPLLENFMSRIDFGHSSINHNILVELS